jgi:hypothetical protein
MNANRKMQERQFHNRAKFEVWGKWMRLSFGVPPLGGPPLIRVNSRDSRAEKPSQTATNLGYNSAHDASSHASSEATVCNRQSKNLKTCPERAKRVEWIETVVVPVV